ncbi:threonine dehydrogenase and related Zn-dependent dehydrogenases [Halarchaeum acidiphilum MH1-52-1]|uniref:Threonine dehydrogenase and related Zn-dependent dehydrogenases n=1 Tax=Halarchaeum acidiphilum MH1-52-1 TaxID=1261545 RepID=U2YEW2_9EURY|nr:threonine dehydrogenase and related Zn-dependent dehydrogenases [Halarchaeum acidiphilum MH1-52-1]
MIQGGGGLGQNAIAVANEFGAETILVEGVDERIERARDFGVDHVVDFREHDTVEARAERVAELTNGRGADVGVEVAGVPDAFAEDPTSSATARATSKSVTSRPDTRPSSTPRSSRARTSR